MKRDPSVQRLLRGELLASSPLGYERARAEMLEELFDLLPAYTQRNPADPGVALIEALAAVIDIFGFYHDRFLTESKIGAAQSLQSVKLLGDTVGYTPRPALAARTLQFFEARTVGVVLAGSKLAGRAPDGPGKVIFETLRSLVIGPAFNRMALDPNVTRHVGALRAVIRRLVTESSEHVTPLDEFAVGALAMINGGRGLELVPVAGARTRALAVARPLRRSYSLDDTRIHRTTEYRHLLHPLPLAEADDESSELVVFEVCDRPILHVPEPSGAQRLRSTLELYVFPPGVDPRDPGRWTPERRWQEVPDFTASEAADRHYRTFVDDRLRTYAILRRRMGYRELLSPEELASVYVRFSPAIGRISDAETVAPGGHLVELNDEYFTSPLIFPKVDGQFVKTDGSLWVVTERSLDLLQGRQIIIENAATQEKFIRTIGARTTGEYLNWRAPEGLLLVAKPLDQPPQPLPLWDRIAVDIIDGRPDSDWRKGLFLQTFGHYFPLKLRVEGTEVVSYPVRPGRGVTHDIADDLLFVTDIPQSHDPVPGWEDRAALSISPLREAIKAGPYHLWDQFYREFENLDWELQASHHADLIAKLTQAAKENKEGQENLVHWHTMWTGAGSPTIKSVTIVPRGSTFIIVQDTSLIRPGDYFMLGKRMRRAYPIAGQEDELDCDAVVTANHAAAQPSLGRDRPGIELERDLADKGEPKPIFTPDWLVAEVLQAVEVHGKIVRLKWPVTYDYAVDFLCPGDRLEEPMTELIIVPQVASVFFGDYFTQRWRLGPNVKWQGLGGKPSTYIALVDGFDAGRLRKSTEWKPKDQGFATTWEDVFFTNLEIKPEDVPVPQSVAANGAPKALVWKVFLGLEIPQAALSNVAGIYVGRLDAAKVFTAATLIPVDLTPKFSEEYSHDGREYQADFRVVDDADLALMKVAEMAGPKDLEYWAELKTPLDLPPESYELVGAKGFLFTGTVLLDGRVWPYRAVVRLNNKELYCKVVGVEVRNSPAYGWEITAQMLGGESRPQKLTHAELIAIDVTPRAEKMRAVRALTAEWSGPELPVFLSEAHATPAPDPSRARYPDKTRANSIELHYASDDFAGFKKIVAWITGQGDGSGLPGYYTFENRRGVLDEKWYKDDSRADNFLFSNGDVDRFKLLKDVPLAGSYILFSEAKGVGEGGDLAAFGRLGARIPAYETTMVDSIIFNSGNFIPVRLGDPEADELIIRNSLKITLRDEEGQDVPLEYSRLLKDFTELPYGDKRKFGFGKTPEGTFTLHFRIDREAEKEYVPEVNIQVYYAAEPYRAGEGEAEREHHAAYPICEGQRVCWKEARYYQFETRPLPWNPLRQLVIMNSGELQAGDYIFIDPAGVSEVSETPCKAEEAAAGAAEAGESEERSRDHIQWTRVVEVDGRMVIVDPPVKIQPRGFYHYRVTGYRRPAGAASPDEDYYKLLQSEEKPETAVPPELVGLSFGNRLMLRPFAEPTGLFAGDDAVKDPERRVLLDHLVPGDRLLVWDRRWQQLWRAHREGQDGASSDKSWFEWPDRQHEAVIKRIVPKLGLVELEEPLPTRFGVEYRLKSGRLDLAVTRASAASFRALPFYREPFQGERALIVLGDGDRRSKFARFTADLPGDLGLASVALERSGTVTSNIEVLTVERASGRWERWTEFGEIDAARRQDQAFVLGVEWIERQDDPCADYRLELKDDAREVEERCFCEDDPVPSLEGELVASPALTIPLPLVAPTTSVSVSFGDGVHGQTPPNGRGNVFIRPVKIGPWCRHVPTRAAQQILAVRRDCLPLRVAAELASARNLVVEVEHSVHEAWQSRGGQHRWRAPLVVEVDLSGLTIPGEVKTVTEGDPPRTLVRLRGLSDAEAVAGYDGVVARPLRPGASAVSVVFPQDLHELLRADNNLSEAEIRERVAVFEVPAAEVWALDDVFYRESMRVDSTVSPGADTVLLAETEGLDEDSSLAFGQGGDPGEPVEVVGVKAVDHATYSATLERPLGRTYRLDRSYLFGNLVEAVQGDSERLVIGSGDGSTRGLRLPLSNRQTILFSSDEHGVLTPGVVLLVDDVPWERVEQFEGRGPRDRVYRLEFEADGEAYVRFGDGVHGAIPAGGFDNIVVALRTGDGARGNLEVGAIDRLLDGNLAVERTRNVIPAAGGKPADDPAAARQQLMERSFTLGRVVTRDDVVRAIRALADVSQARLDPTAPAEVLRAVVALRGRRRATASELELIRARVVAVMPLAAETRVELVDAEQLSVHLVLEITVAAGFAQGEALQALERAFSAREGGFFDLDRWPIGAPLRAGDVYEQAFSLPAVATARIRWMSREVPPADLPAKLPDALRPGPRQVIRCDNDRVGDPNGIRGTLRVRIRGGGA